MRKWEWKRYTLTQLVAMLDRSDPDDPHAGGTEVFSTSQLDALFHDDD